MPAGIRFSLYSVQLCPMHCIHPSIPSPDRRSLFAGWPFVVSETSSSSASAVIVTIARTTFPCQQIDCSINQNFIGIATRSSGKFHAGNLQSRGFSKRRMGWAQCARVWTERMSSSSVAVSWAPAPRFGWPNGAWPSPCARRGKSGVSNPAGTGAGAAPSAATSANSNSACSVCGYGVA